MLKFGVNRNNKTKVVEKVEKVEKVENKLKIEEDDLLSNPSGLIQFNSTSNSSNLLHSPTRKDYLKELFAFTFDSNLIPDYSHDVQGTIANFLYDYALAHPKSPLTFKDVANACLIYFSESVSNGDSNNSLAGKLKMMIDKWRSLPFNIRFDEDIIDLLLFKYFIPANAIINIILNLIEQKAKLMLAIKFHKEINPETVDSVRKFAKNAEGIGDRKLLAEMGGLINKSGSGIVINVDGRRLTNFNNYGEINSNSNNGSGNDNRRIEAEKFAMRRFEDDTRDVERLLLVENNENDKSIKEDENKIIEGEIIK